MPQPDPLIMFANVAQVASERPELGKKVVRALHQHLVMVEGRQPSVDEFRDYVARLSALDERLLRRQLGLPPRAQPKGERGPGTDQAPEAAVAARKPGRPAWTRDLFWAHYRKAQARATPPYTYRAIAQQFEVLDGARGTEPEYVRKLARRYGLPPE